MDIGKSANAKAYYNTVIPLDAETELIASTLWSYIPPSEEHLTKKMCDRFQENPKPRVPSFSKRFNEEHLKCRTFIDMAIRESL